MQKITKDGISCAIFLIFFLFSTGAGIQAGERPHAPNYQRPHAPNYQNRTRQQETRRRAPDHDATLLKAPSTEKEVVLNYDEYEQYKGWYVRLEDWYCGGGAEQARNQTAEVIRYFKSAASGLSDDPSKVQAYKIAQDRAWAIRIIKQARKGAVAFFRVSDAIFSSESSEEGVRFSDDIQPGESRTIIKTCYSADGLSTLMNRRVQAARSFKNAVDKTGHATLKRIGAAMKRMRY